MSYVLVYICNICGFQAIFKYMDIVLHMDLNKKMLSLMTHAGYKGGDIAHAGCVFFFAKFPLPFHCVTYINKDY